MKTTTMQTKTMQKHRTNPVAGRLGSVMPALFAFLLLLSSISFASVNPKLELLNYSLSESPVQPGHTLVLTLRIKSLEPDNCASRVAVQLAVSYPLSISGSDTQYVESLCYTDADSAGTFTFLLPVDNLATTGTYPVSVSTTYEKLFTKFSEANTLNVRVGGAPAFTASVASSSPVDIYPGDDASVTVTFQNTGASMVQSSLATATARGIEVKWAGEEQAVGSIVARGSASATFHISAPKNLAPGAYPLDVRLDYAGEDRQNGTALFHFEVPVKPKAEFVAAYPVGSTLRAGAPQNADILLTNTGTQEARKLKVRIRPLFPFSTDGTVRYIDSLKPGQSVNLTYVITVDKDATSGSQLVGLLMDFEDPQGKTFSDSADFAMPVRLASFQESVEPYMPYLYLVVLVVVLVVLRKAAGAMKKKK